jgi:hypothetical protein
MIYAFKTLRGGNPSNCSRTIRITSNVIIFINVVIVRNVVIISINVVILINFVIIVINVTIIIAVILLFCYYAYNLRWQLLFCRKKLTQQSRPSTYILLYKVQTK